MSWKSSKRIVLASGSPRRAELLEKAGFNFEVIKSDVEEIYPDDLPVESVPEFLACLKTQHVFDSLNERKNTIVIGADSIVLLGDQILGKPKDEKEAYRFLSMLSGKKHQVITGVNIITEKKNIAFSSLTHVYFRPLDHEEITQYVATGSPMDKAGAYGIQDGLVYVKIDKIEGTYANVMGLPIDLVYESLKSIMTNPS